MLSHCHANLSYVTVSVEQVAAALYVTPPPLFSHALILTPSGLDGSPKLLQAIALGIGTISSAIAERPRCSVGQLWRKYLCCFPYYRDAPHSETVIFKLFGPAMVGRKFQVEGDISQQPIVHV